MKHPIRPQSWGGGCRGQAYQTKTIRHNQYKNYLSWDQLALMYANIRMSSTKSTWIILGRVKVTEIVFREGFLLRQGLSHLFSPRLTQTKRIPPNTTSETLFLLESWAGRKMNKLPKNPWTDPDYNQENLGDPSRTKIWKVKLIQTLSENCPTCLQPQDQFRKIQLSLAQQTK